MTTKMTLPLSEVPGVLRESLRTTLTAHGFLVVRLPVGHPNALVAQPLTPDQLEALLNEVGRNGAQALFSIDMTPENWGESGPPRREAVDSDVPSTADRLSVGQTLRMLARTAPGDGTREALARVGEWLTEGAQSEINRGAKGKAA